MPTPFLSKPMFASPLRLFAVFALLFMLSAFGAPAQVTNLGDCSTIATFPYANGSGVAVDPHGNVFVTTVNGVLYEIAPNGTVTPVNLQGYTLNSPAGMVIDSAGNLYIADTKNNRVVEVAAGGNVSSVNLQGNSLVQPMAVAVDAAGDLFIADSGNSRVLEVATSNGNVSTVNLGSATPKLLQGVAASADGNTVYIAPTTRATGFSRLSTKSPTCIRVRRR
jgi:serine/threonine-protein kinase